MDKTRRTVMMAAGRTRRAWASHMKAIAREIGIPDSYRQIILHLYKEPGANQKEIAEFANVTTAAVNQVIKDMIEEGYLEKKIDESDRRYTKLYLTSKGEETALRLRELLRRSDAVITSVISAEKEEEMIILLDEIYECIRRDLTSC